jgi:hypothetical protein
MVPLLFQSQYEPELLLVLETPFVTRYRGQKQLQVGIMGLAISPGFFCAESGV